MDDEEECGTSGSIESNKTRIINQSNDSSTLLSLIRESRVDMTITT
ncbi:34430_t:CDS:2 [Gigaspora margarita]|uniref:34430_t:CDS:1 n=1 Tax=Gigaspora margarita TaxID=4874 RepID=A0ABN7V4V5_GIGMA|nr:34430_t:CDS:2 [Gigaspora margarita]